MRKRRPVVVRSRLGNLAGWSDGVVAYYERHVPDGPIVPYWVLLEESVQLHQPHLGDWEGRWYVDLVHVTVEPDGSIELVDRYVDVIVGGRGPRFRVVDLDELGDALVSGRVSAEEAAETLRALQVFLDTHLQRRDDFPPAVLSGGAAEGEGGGRR